MEGAAGGFNKPAPPEAAEAAARRAQECHECIFCKRGFTNAQALGGHMNIHRKERSGGGRSSSTRSGGAALPAAAQHRGAGNQVQLGLTLGRNEDVDLELRLWH